MPAYRPDIDGLRALAVLLVVGFHAFPAAVPAGFIGVDVFFVISGFLISSIIFRECDEGHFSIRAFYERRINRIFPALVLVMACTLAAAFFLRDESLRRLVGKHVAAGAAFVQNFALLGEAGYFDSEARAKPLLHLWSLAIEEQFYLFWPLMFAMAGPAPRRRAGLLVGILATSFAANLWTGSAHPGLTYYAPFTRFWELALGGALALNPKVARGIAWNGWVCSFGTPIGLLLIAAGLAVTDPQQPFPEWVGLFPTIGTALVIAAGPTSFLNRRLLAAPAMVTLGLASYPIYLWHWPLLSFLHIGAQPDAPGLAATLLAVAASLALGWATWKFVEQPLKHVATVARRARWLAAAMVAVFCAGAATWLWPQDDASGEGASRLERYKPEWQFTASCLARFGPLFVPKVFDDRDFCMESAPGAKRSVYVIGDSHANRLAVGLMRFDAATNYINLARGNCLPLLGLEGTLADRKRLDCQPTSDALLDAALRAPDAQALVVTAYFARAFNGQFIAADARMDERMQQTLAKLGAWGKPVVIMLDIPILPFHPRTCLPGRGDTEGAAMAACRMPRAQHDRDLALYEPRLRALAQPFANIRIFDPTPLLCDDVHCYGARNGKLLYWDPNHLDSQAAAAVAAELSKLLEPVR